MEKQRPELKQTESWVAGALARRKTEGLFRRIEVFPTPGGVLHVEGRRSLNFSSNDYLDLARDPRVVEAASSALRRYGAGAGASRLMAGSFPIHRELEERLAEFKNYGECLLFGSGFLANVGVIPALVGRADVVIADRLVHASLIDGALLSRARLVRFRHNDPGDLERCLETVPASARRLVVTEALFSMDGDMAPLRRIAEVARRYGALLFVDEAHATGVLGPGGKGLVVQEGLNAHVQICMGTLGKALGSYGAFVTCSPQMREYLVNFARTAIYSTALPPPAAAAALCALEVIETEPQRVESLERKCRFFRGVLREEGLEVPQHGGPIVPVLIGGNDACVRAAERLRREGIVVCAIRPPTVPAGTARLRLSVTCAHREADLSFAARKIAEALKLEGVRCGKAE